MWLGYHFQGQRSRLPGHFGRRVGASGGCSGGHGNVLAGGNCCYAVVCSPAQGTSASTGGGEGRGHITAAAHLQLVNTYNQCCHHCWQEPVCLSRGMPVVMVTSTYLQLIVLSDLNTLFVVWSLSAKMPHLQLHSSVHDALIRCR